MNDSDEQLLQLAVDGDTRALGELFSRYVPQLRKMVSSRIDPRVAARIDVSDVIQEVHVEVVRRLGEYSMDSGVTLYHWMRFLTKQKLAEIARRNIVAQARDVRREQPLNKFDPANSSIVLAAHLLAKVNSPSSVVSKAEVARLVNEAIGKLDVIDREVLLLRHVEQLKTAEAAEKLGISQNTCRQRHIRALKQLRELLLEHDLSWGDL